MQFLELINRLKEEFSIQIRRQPNFGEVRDIALYDPASVSRDPETLYFAIPGATMGAIDRPILLVAACEPQDVPEGGGVALCAPADWVGVFNRAKAFLSEESKMNERYVELMHLATAGTGITQLINKAATLLGNAIVLINSFDRVLAHSTNYAIEDPLWAENIERGYCSFEFVQKVKENRNMQEWSKRGEETHTITLPGDLQPKLVARLIDRGHEAGGLVMIAHHTEISSKHRRMLPMIGKLLLDTYERDSPSEDLQNTRESAVLYELLDERDPNGFDSFGASQYEFPPEMRVVVARFIDRIDNRYLKRAFQMNLKSIFPSGIPVLYKNYLAIVTDEISEEQILSLQTLALAEQVRVGISWPFSALAEFKRHFNQAVSAIKEAQRLYETELVHDYTDFACYDLFFNYTGKQPLRDYCHPALYTLQAYDEENRTEYLSTLKEFLENAKNSTDAASTLFIHRNTLQYRIKRIEELTGLDLKKPGTTYALLESFRIMTYLENA